MKTEKTGKKNLLPAIAVVIVVVSFIAAIYIFINHTVNRTTELSEIVVTQDEITVTGMYGTSYMISDIKDIKLVEGAPVLGRKIRGAGLSSRKVWKGQYEVEGLGEYRVFLFGDNGPYVVIDTESETVLIMYEESKMTTDLYESLINIVS